MSSIRHIDALLGTAWAWDDDDDDELEPPRAELDADFRLDPGAIKAAR